MKKKSKSNKKKALETVQIALDAAESANMKKEQESEDAKFNAFLSAHPAVTEEVAEDIFFGDSPWDNATVEVVEDGHEGEVADLRREFPWLTEAEAVRYLFDPQLQWKGKPKDDDEETWQPVLKKDGTIDRLVPPFSASDLVTDESEFNRLINEAGNDAKKVEDANRRYYDAVKRDGYAQTEGWVAVWPKMRYVK